MNGRVQRSAVDVVQIAVTVAVIDAVWQPVGVEVPEGVHQIAVAVAVYAIARLGGGGIDGDVVVVAVETVRAAAARRVARHRGCRGVAKAVPIRVGVPGGRARHGRVEVIDERVAVVVDGVADLGGAAPDGRVRRGAVDGIDLGVAVAVVAQIPDAVAVHVRLIGVGGGWAVVSQIRDAVEIGVVRELEHPHAVHRLILGRHHQLALGVVESVSPGSRLDGVGAALDTRDGIEPEEVRRRASVPPLHPEQVPVGVVGDAWQVLGLGEEELGGLAPGLPVDGDDLDPVWGVGLGTLEEVAPAVRGGVPHPVSVGDARVIGQDGAGHGIVGRPARPLPPVGPQDVPHVVVADGRQVPRRQAEGACSQLGVGVRAVPLPPRDPEVVSHGPDQVVVCGHTAGVGGVSRPGLQHGAGRVVAYVDGCAVVQHVNQTGDIVDIESLNVSGRQGYIQRRSDDSQVRLLEHVVEAP